MSLPCLVRTPSTPQFPRQHRRRVYLNEPLEDTTHDCGVGRPAVAAGRAFSARSGGIVLLEETRDRRDRLLGLGAGEVDELLGVGRRHLDAVLGERGL